MHTPTATETHSLHVVSLARLTLAWTHVLGRSRTVAEIEVLDRKVDDGGVFL
jgi:hypothetical protein